MQIIKLSQVDDREAWLEARRGVITGTKSKYIKPLTRGKNKTPAGFWQLVAEKVAVAPDFVEKDIDRGLRLQEEAMQLFSEKYAIDLDTDPGMWVSGMSESIGYSPDGAEPGDNPTYATEVKCLSSANHLKYIITDKRRQQTDEYKTIDSIPNDASNAYREQVIQAFVVNENLERLYFILYDDRIALEPYMLHVITIERQDIKDEIEAQRQTQLNVLEEVNALVVEMAAVNE